MRSPKMYDWSLPGGAATLPQEQMEDHRLRLLQWLKGLFEIAASTSTAYHLFQVTGKEQDKRKKANIHIIVCFGQFASVV